ncbi:unnamed protein product [Bathycoccus prasinos]
MDSGKEDKAISSKEEGKSVKEWDKFSHDLYRDLGGTNDMPWDMLAMEEEFVRLSQKKKSKAEEEEEEKADLLSSSDNSFVSTELGNWPNRVEAPDEEEFVERGSPEGMGRRILSDWIPGYPSIREWIPEFGNTWMDQNPSPYESHGTGEEDEVVEGEDNDIDDADLSSSSDNSFVSTELGKKSDEKEDLEEWKRSLDETERQLSAQLMTFLRNNYVDTAKMLFMTRDDNNKQWRVLNVSNGRWRKYNKVWDPDPNDFQNDSRRRAPPPPPPEMDDLAKRRGASDELQKIIADVDAKLEPFLDQFKHAVDELERECALIAENAKADADECAREASKILSDLERKSEEMEKKNLGTRQDQLLIKQKSLKAMELLTKM